ncbi:ADP-ribosylglycohydrolase family protein [Tumidithrix elongata RA019]|uniref:ADP-ribosylglycohydrolase family protein n=1 Tax=Tumidithrix elongata BACA0141 TaxID=2716417 RepID=A0AAW9PVJ7_9CYAN|nr:ADP-ribosylglycohydrolase family protein [Tumidithrix elongata RA019]
MLKNSKTLAGLLGLSVGDALGVPVEFSSRSELVASPITKMTGYGTWQQPLGTWSDDSSLSFCLAESMCQGFSLDALAEFFCRWRSQGYWSAHGNVFDVGATTALSIYRLHQGVPPLEAGETSDGTNGNGSIMRILPLAFYHKTLSLRELIERVHQVSCITHAHPRSQIACGIYICIAVQILLGHDPQDAYLLGIKDAKQLYVEPALLSELHHFERVLSEDIPGLTQDEINSSGYVVDTLEAALWCLLTSTSYEETVLKAVNLGNDTDTTATVAGGLAGIYFGVESIPAEWIDQLARKDDIIDLANRLETAVYS